MTLRAWALLGGGAALLALGVAEAWPEPTGLGGASIALVLLVVPLLGRTPRGDVSVSRSALRVTRGDRAVVRVAVRLRRGGRFLRLVEGPLNSPRASTRVPRAARGASAALAIPFDTSTRGRHLVGPFHLVQADPWGLLRRQVARADGGWVVVQPRTHPVRRELTSVRADGDSERATRRSGDQHFHALREYVLGDEPRQVHWRSSARAGKMVVRQQVTSASIGTVVVLDCDESAYAAGGSFFTGRDAEQFELAVEVAASLTVSRLGPVEQVELLTTERGSRPVTARAGVARAALDALAVVQPVAPVDAALDELVSAVRRARAAHLLLVTGTPSARTQRIVRRLALSVPSVVVVRVRPTGRSELTGVRVQDVHVASDLA